MSVALLRHSSMPDSQSLRRGRSWSKSRMYSPDESRRFHGYFPVQNRGLLRFQNQVKFSFSCAYFFAHRTAFGDEPCTMSMISCRSGVCFLMLWRYLFAASRSSETRMIIETRPGTLSRSLEAMATASCALRAELPADYFPII